MSVKAQVGRLKARAGRLKARVKAIKPRVIEYIYELKRKFRGQNIEFHKPQKVLLSLFSEN